MGSTTNLGWTHSDSLLFIFYWNPVSEKRRDFLFQTWVNSLLQIIFQAEDFVPCHKLHTMHRFNFRLYVLIFFVTLSSTLLRAQGTSRHYSNHEMRKTAVWIEMMNDPSANYFETIKAFREFWKDRVLPKEAIESGSDQFEIEVGLVENAEEEKERERERERDMSDKKREESNFYAAQVRAFKGWLQDVKPWVRSDGSIVSQAEREAILKQQANELKAIEQQQK